MKAKFELWSLLATLVFLFVSPTPTAIPKVTSQEILVTRVIDGDTIELSNGKRVRYIGIDTPERDECFFSGSKVS